MKWSSVIVAALCLGVGVGGGFYWGRHGSVAEGKVDDDKAESKTTAPGGAEPAEGHGEDSVAPICLVQVAPLNRGYLATPIMALGTIENAPGGQHILTAPYDGIVSDVALSEGTAVSVGSVLITLTPSAELLAQQQEAVVARTASERDVTIAHQRLALHVATAQEVSQAEATAELARLKVATWESRLAKRQVICSEAGVLSHLLVRPGQALLLGAPVAELTVPGHTIARIGIEPADLPLIHPGQTVSLQPLRRHGALGAQATNSAITATIIANAAQVTAETKLVDVLVGLPADSTLLVGESVHAEFPRSIHNTLIIPRQGLVRDDAEWVVFTVVKDTAKRHVVSVVAENHDQAAITATDLSDDAAVIVLGNSVVSDGMMVRVMAAATP